MHSSEPRIPIEVDKRPVFRAGPRFGCSAIALVAIVAVAAFYFLFTQVTPNWVTGGVKMVSSIFNSASPTPAVALPSPTAQVTTTPQPAPTPSRAAIKASYVQVVNTGGVGVKLRSEPKQNATIVRSLTEGTVVQVIGPDQTAASGSWANVRTLDANGGQRLDFTPVSGANASPLIKDQSPTSSPSTLLNSVLTA